MGRFPQYETDTPESLSIMRGVQLSVELSLKGYYGQITAAFKTSGILFQIFKNDIASERHSGNTSKRQLIRDALKDAAKEI